jgi:hypothetical protein
MHRNHVLRIAAAATLAASVLGISAGTAGAAPRRPASQVFCEALGGTYVDDWGPGAFGCFWLGGAYVVCGDNGLCQEI